MSSIQFTIPCLAGDGIDFPTLRRHGIRANLPHTTIEYSTRSAPIGQMRITCSIDMALILIEALRLLAGEADRRRDLELAMACAQGVTSAFEAIDEERAKPSDESPASHIKPAPN